MESTAVRQGNNYILNGEKIFVSKAMSDFMKALESTLYEGEGDF